MKELEQDQFGQELFVAGEHVPSGRYKQIDGSQVIDLEQEGVLPAGLEGRVTCYARIQTWGDIQSSQSSQSKEESA